MKLGVPANALAVMKSVLPSMSARLFELPGATAVGPTFTKFVKVVICVQLAPKFVLRNN